MKFTVPVILIVTMMIGAGSPAVFAQGESGNVRFDTGSIFIEITGNGNVPKFSFAPSDDLNSTYNVFFSKILEINDTNDNGVYDEDDTKIVSYSLPAFDWEISDIDNQSTSAHFNLTGTPKNTAKDGDWSVSFNNHLTADANDFKFDVVINGYDFVESEEKGQNTKWYNNSMLVLSFRLSFGDDAEASQSTDDTVTFGDGGFFNIEETAQDATGDVDVSMSYEVNGSEAEVYVAYDMFSGDMYHDPTLGVQASALGSGEDAVSSQANSDDGSSTEDNGGQDTDIVDSPLLVFTGSLGLFITIPLIRKFR